MNLWRQLLRRARHVFFRRATERAMDLEIRDHIDREIDQHVTRGVSPADARRRALADFGSVEAVKESARDARGGRVAEDFVSDCAYAFRVFRHNPGPALLAVLTFAVGLGMTTAIFSVAYGVLLRPLPYADPDRLMAVWERDVPRNANENMASIANLEAWRDANHSFTGIAALMPTTVTLTSAPTPERVVGAEVTPGYFGLLGVLPALGRDFGDRDALADDAVIISDGFWKARFGGDRSVLGRPLQFSGRPYTVVGIMPADFDPPQFGWLGEQPVWFPMAFTPQKRDWGRYLLLVGRLNDRATVESARADLAAISARREQEKFNAGWSASVIPLRTQIAGDARSSLIVVVIAVALLMVIAVANVATLALAATERRARELGMRRALGATDGRLFRQLLAQNALLGAIGTSIGLGAAVPGCRWLVSHLPPETPRLAAIHVDAPVLLIALLMAVLSIVVIGTLAARRGCKASRLGITLRVDGDTRTTARMGAGVLVGAEIALGIAVSVMALLMVRSVSSLGRIDLGFQPDGVIVARVAASSTSYPTPASQNAFFDDVIRQFQAVPGVTAAGVISLRPFGGAGPADSVRDAQAPPGSPALVADIRVTSNDALAVLRVPVVSGALFDPLAEATAPARVVINRTLAETLWPGQNALGRHLQMNMYGGMSPEVIGVVGDVHLIDARTAPRATAYLAASRFSDTQRDIVVSTTAAPDAIIPGLRRALANVAPGLPLYRVTPLSSAVSRSLTSDRFTMALLGIFAAVALLLAGIGVFGVFAGDVTARHREIGLRLALGGTATGVILILLTRAMKRAAIGAAAGLVLAMLAARSMASLLFHVEPYDPLSLALVTTAVLALAIAATLMPAMGALRRSPLEALREP